MSRSGRPDSVPSTPSPATRAPLSLDRLRTYPFLAPLPDVILLKLQPNLDEQQYDPGALILRLGDYSDAAYYVSEGVVEVRLDEMDRTAGAPKAATEAAAMLGDLPSPDRSTRVRLGAGEIFGEMGALSRYPVSADVVAASSTTCLVIRTPALRLMLKQRSLADFRAFVDERYRTRTLAAHLRRTDIFQSLDDTAIEGLRQRAELLSFDPGEIIVEQGAAADALYLVRGGYVKVGARAGSAEIAITYLRKGDYAGETAILTDQPWPVSLTALEHVEMVRLARTEFMDIARAYPAVERHLRDVAARRADERRLALEQPTDTRYQQMAMDTGLINGESVLLIDLQTCTRCDDCVTACAETHGGTPRFVREGARYGRWSIPVACYQCTDPVCMIGCPTGAITRPLSSFVVTIDRDTCIGCHNCAHRCPWGNIIELPYESPSIGHTINLATKCDLCVGRTGGPACVDACPHGSAVRISFKDLTRVVQTLSR
jgi:CRP-like cAMP-binding protein/Fe-S-cluster-containing dehydrogenase component